MAMAQAAISGGLRFSSTSNLVVKTFAASTPLSNFTTGELTITAGVSDFVLSINAVSSPSVLFLAATSTMRINFGGGAGTSHGSAGQQFSDFYGFMGSFISGPLSLHFANSTLSAQTVTYLIGQAG